MAEVSGSLVNFWVRVSGTTNAFKKLVCTEDSQFEITNETSERRTNCGIKRSIADPTFTASGNAVQNPNPTSLEVSYNDIKAWQKTKTMLDFNYKSDADVANGLDLGEGVQNYGSGYFESSTLTASADADGLVSFSWSFGGSGTLDNYENNTNS